MDPDLKHYNEGNLCKLLSCVPDLNPKSFGLKDPDQDPPLFTTNLEESLKNVLKSEQIHHNSIPYTKQEK